MPQKLPLDLFLKSFEYCPRVCIEVIVRNKNKEILLIRRESEPYKNLWHFPGGFILKDESFVECITRLSKDEIGIDIQSVDAKFDIYENLSADPRGHLIHLIWQGDSTNEILKDNIKYFSNPPEDMVPFQKEIWNKFLLLS